MILKANSLHFFRGLSRSEGRSYLFHTRLQATDFTASAAVVQIHADLF